MTLLVQLVLIALTSIATLLGFDLLPREGGFALGADFGLGPVLLWAALPMYIGLLCGQAFRYVLSIGGNKTSLSEVVSSIKNTPSTYAAILFSPIVLFAIMAASQESLQTLQTLALSFQNGFFINQLMAVALKGEKR